MSEPPPGPAPGPAVVLVDPQLGENIGMAARAMLNCGLADLRLVRPRDGWPSDSAAAAAAGAVSVIAAARVFETTTEAVADLGLVFAATARARDMTKETVTPEAAARRLRATGNGGGLLFGPEAVGLGNDDVALTDAVLSIPVNPEFPSLNLAQAVFACAHAWWLLGDDTPDAEVSIPKETRPADKGELTGLFEHLERELDAGGFFRVEEKRPVMVRNLRNLLQRAGLTEQEVRTLRGVVKSLAGRRDGDA